MRFKKVTTIALDREVKKKLEELRKECVNEDDLEFEGWDDFFDNFIQYVRKHLDRDEEQENKIRTQ